MPGWTRFIIRHRWKVLALWLVLLLVGGFAASRVGDLLTNRFSVPGSDAERGLNLVKERFAERGDGAFSLVVKTKRPVAARPPSSARRCSSCTPASSSPPRRAGTYDSRARVSPRRPRC